MIAVKIDLSGPVTKVCAVFNSRMLPYMSVRKIREMTITCNILETLVIFYLLETYPVPGT